jgi:uncharacterized protein YaaR (DUF327 family)
MKTKLKVKSKISPPMKLKKSKVKNTVPSQCCCERKAAREILARNMQGDPKLNESSDFLFAEMFLTSLLKEQNEDTEGLDATQTAPPEDFTPEQNENDFENSLEPETDASKFDIRGISPDVTMETIKKVKEWAIKLNEFEKFLNNPSDTSLHRILSDNDRAGSLLRGITRKASDSITRIAGEIAKLKEVLNTFVNTAPKKIRDLEQNTSVQ